MRSAISEFRAAAVLLAVLPLAGCSLLTIKLPEDPLSKQAINARLATHRFVGHFSKTVSDAADEITAKAESNSSTSPATSSRLSRCLS